MLTANEAFRKFRSNLELTQKEQDSASSRQKEIRGLMDESFAIEHDFLTGSYRRWTKTKPLKDVDIFCVFHEYERARYRDGKRPAVVLGDVEKVLAKKYGSANVSAQRRAVTVEFTDSTDEERVMSFDVVPAGFRPAFVGSGVGDFAPFGGDFPYEFMAFFATMADRIGDDWPEPAGLGPPVSDSMDAASARGGEGGERRLQR
jgi:hypothetical protein